MKPWQWSICRDAQYATQLVASWRAAGFTGMVKVTEFANFMVAVELFLAPGAVR